MNWFEFEKKMFDLGCFSIHQVYAWRPGFDRNNLVRWTKKGRLVHLRRGWYAFPEYKDKPEFAEYIAGKIYNPSYISLHSALAFYGLIPESVVNHILSCTPSLGQKFPDVADGYGLASFRERGRNGDSASLAHNLCAYVFFSKHLTCYNGTYYNVIHDKDF